MNKEFERCCTFLAEMMEKYGLEIYAKRFLERFLEEA